MYGSLKNVVPSASDLLPKLDLSTFGSSYNYPSDQLGRWNTQLTWGSKVGHVPETRVVAHVPGWTVLERLYVFNGTIYVVSKFSETLPDLKFVYSKGINIEDGEDAELARVPTAEHINVITPLEARHLFGTRTARTIDDLTFFVNDPPQFVTHYYHWSAELWFGLVRTFFSLSKENSRMPAPKRIIFNHITTDKWRDYAAMNEWVFRSSAPGIVMEFADDWQDRAEMGHPFVFERVILADRSAAMMSYNYARYQRTASAVFALPGPKTWFLSIRNNVVGFAGIDPKAGSSSTSTPVITYVSRQEWGRRMLIKEDHEKLVQELEKLCDTHGYEVNIVSMDKLSRLQQLQLAARTTIMMGVHGNGLTSLLWMNPTPRSTVMEFFYPGGFAHDYEYTTRAVGMTHYGFWGDKYFTHPDVPQPAYPEGFQGNSIPIDGELVARLCVERLTVADMVDD
ncbi:hypothetical protein FISHEDRAFT_40033 [Fistulina hepatica ATCC 64428]|uniref:Glycosyltransferase 61 catalytic domain-containing protein n=1 Tax=Fistulina hepatica ATCC 64428 TaxID=1128425 RepID=A0A0D7AGM4_9AGAR|nr:hypothetical protein FISHEDRAFT_40033 [Fistulina hepatica ATCC 64428]